ncbi:hypothetical protein [Stenotrophomonas sp. CFBP8980]|uniref:hypothetical protein n=1 Tax=Stenotrophomonas sp. CFBP8980 TaxID=3096523 RepID=UPI0005AF3632|nr:hypothetical protein [Stenotrophomonas sp. CFBP8980]KIP82267.1 membrane protein [Stenotrophomonas maltophilia]MDY1033864.1 hypothetical protein [Stenotrophomonas sp. CFBP8980]
MTTSPQRAFVLTCLVLLMAATRVNHFAAIPDASWAVFFIGGFYLRSWTRWAFPLLMALAVLVDWIVIGSLGLDFWQHYCVSPGYWMLLPAYFAMWAGGMALGHGYQGAQWSTLAKATALVVAAVAVCHLFAQGGFYWTTRNVADPTVGGWLKNYADWFVTYLGTTTLYVGLAAALQLAVEQVGKLRQAQRDVRG